VVAVNGDDDRPARSEAGTESWTQSARLRVGEPGYFDGGALQITLRSIDARSARIIVQDVGAERVVNLRAPGRLSGVQWPPYEIWLDSIGIDNTATIVVSKNR
jgi:hypothetical protein